MDALYAEALRLLPEREGLRFEELRQRGAEAGEREVTEMGGLIQKALRTLPAEKNQRLFALVEKAVDLQLAKQQAAAQTAARAPSQIKWHEIAVLGTHPPPRRSRTPAVSARLPCLARPGFRHPV